MINKQYVILSVIVSVFCIGCQCSETFVLDPPDPTSIVTDYSEALFESSGFLFDTGIVLNENIMGIIMDGNCRIISVDSSKFFYSECCKYLVIGVRLIYRSHGLTQTRYLIRSKHLGGEWTDLELYMGDGFLGEMHPRMDEARIVNELNNKFYFIRGDGDRR